MNTNESEEIAAYWAEACAQLGIEASQHHASTFADRNLSKNVDKIARLALSGQKRATAHLVLDFERNGVPRRHPGDYWVLLDSALAPIAVLRVIRVEEKMFNAVEVDTALAEGEGDLSLEYWARVHGPYFERQCGLWGVTWREDLPVVIEHFERLWPREDAPPAPT